MTKTIITFEISHDKPLPSTFPEIVANRISTISYVEQVKAIDLESVVLQKSLDDELRRMA